MPVNFIPLSFFCHTRELKKTHHLVVVECGLLNQIVGGMVNLAQIP